MLKTRLFCTTLVLILFSCITLAQPRLTVVVVVDGMTHECLKALQPHWKTGGLRLLYEESYQTVASFPHQVYGGQETMATLMTGTTPNNHGIMSDAYYDRSDRETQIRTILFDKKVSGIGTTTQISPRSIISTTITDEWRMMHGTSSKIYAIGLHPQATVLMAGHAANACCWLDSATQKWVTTSFYPEGLPTAADNMNISGRINTLIAGDWKPRMNIEQYPMPAGENNKTEFSYHYKDVLLQSPIANSMVIELALNLQQQQKLGKDQSPDLLLLQLNTLSPSAESDIITTIEQTDLYMGINQDLGFFIDHLNKHIGRDNYQMLIVGRPVKGHSLENMRMANIPIKHFNLDRAAALTGAYLMAIHGHERWIEGAYGPFIYLNRMLIEKKGLSLETFERQVANFLMEFEGIQVAYPIHEAMISAERVSVYRKHSGDVYFRLLENWLLDTNEEQGFDSVIQARPVVPVLYWSHAATTFPTEKMEATAIKSLISPMK